MSGVVSSSLPRYGARTVLDAIIVGGGPGGLSAALCLARVGRRVLLLDEGHYRNERVQHMHNVINSDHTSPSKFRESAAQQILQRYSTVERRLGVRAEKVTMKQLATDQEQKEFPPLANVRVEVASSPTISSSSSSSTSISEPLFARKLILATGMKDLPLPIPGWKELWGTVIQFCPYCDGYEQLDGDWAVLIRSNAAERESSPELHLPAFPTKMSAGYLATLYALNKRLTLLTHGQKASDLFTPEQLKSFETKGIKIYEQSIESVKGIEGTQVKGGSSDDQHNDPIGLEVKLSGVSSALQFRSLYSRVSTIQSSIVRQLGLKLHPMFGTVEVDPFGRTSQSHIFVCGDASQQIPSVPNAMGSGGSVGAGANADMAGEDMFGTV